MAGNLLKRAADYGRYLFIKAAYRPLERLGVHVIPVHFYEPVADSRELRRRPGLWEGESALPGVEVNLDEQLRLLREVFPAFKDEYVFPRRKTASPHEYYLDNGSFGPVDAEVAHCMARRFSPRRTIEIGSGFSTCLLARACLMNKEQAGVPTELVSIDPYPKTELLAGLPGLARLVREKAENVGVDFFSALESGDILFVDSSHVVRTGGDVNFLYLEVLPRLKPGVLVHVHDIFLPREYPKEWFLKLRRSWTEQYLLQAFLAFNNAYSVVWCSHLMHRRYPQELKNAFPGYDGSSLPASFWIRRTL
jgi:predicted O-methyltransferase YrrM